MAIVKKDNKKIEICGSGTLINVDGSSFSVEDEKTGVQTLNLSDLMQFIGKEIKFAISNTEQSVEFLD